MLQRLKVEAQSERALRLSAQAELAACQASAASLEAQLTAETASARQTEAALRPACSLAAEELRLLKGREEQAAAEAQAKAGQIADLQQAVIDQTQRLQQARSQLKAAQPRIAGLVLENEQAKAGQAQAAGLQHENDQLKSHIARCEDALKKFSTHVHSQDQQLASVTADRQQLEVQNKGLQQQVQRLQLDKQCAETALSFQQQVQPGHPLHQQLQQQLQLQQQQLAQRRQQQPQQPQQPLGHLLPAPSSATVVTLASALAAGSQETHKALMPKPMVDGKGEPCPPTACTRSLCCRLLKSGILCMYSGECLNS